MEECDHRHQEWIVLGSYTMCDGCKQFIRSDGDEIVVHQPNFVSKAEERRIRHRMEKS